MTDNVEQLLTRERAIQSRLTPKGKKVKIVKVANTSLFEIIFEEGGKVPREMNGRWTSPRLADDKINIYLGRVWDMADEARRKADIKASRAKANKAKRDAKEDDTETEDVDGVPGNKSDEAADDSDELARMVEASETENVTETEG